MVMLKETAEKYQSDMIDFAVESNISGQTALTLVQNGANRGLVPFIKLRPDHGRDAHNFSNRYPQLEIVYDTPFSFALEFEGQPLAVAGFYHSDWGGNYICLKQLQGIKLSGWIPNAALINSGVNGMLLGLGSWRRSLVQLTENYSRFISFNEMMIVTSRTSEWSRIRDTEHGWRVYDQTALDLGYQFLPALQRYSKLLL